MRLSFWQLPDPLVEVKWFVFHPLFENNPDLGLLLEEGAPSTLLLGDVGHGLQLLLHLVGQEDTLLGILLG